jgi:hypothetical protein
MDNNTCDEAASKNASRCASPTDVGRGLTPAYFPIQKRWRLLRPLFEREVTIRLAHLEMEAYAQTRAADLGYEHRPREFSIDLRPADYDSCSWRWDRGRRGPEPGYWAWACHSACHWLAAVNLYVISALEPDRPWRVATSDRHSTVVDLGRGLLFDTNFLALRVTPEQCWADAVEGPGAKVLPLGFCQFHTKDKGFLAAVAR